MKPKPDPYDHHSIESKQFLMDVMLYMLCIYTGGAPKNVVQDAIDSYVDRFMEYNDPQARLAKEMKQYDY
jgi:hypothetical protein